MVRDGGGRGGDDAPRARETHLAVPTPSRRPGSLLFLLVTILVGAAVYLLGNSSSLGLSPATASVYPLGRSFLADFGELRNSSPGRGPGDVNIGDVSGGARGRIAVAYFTRAPIGPAALERIYDFSVVLGGWGRESKYQLIVVVDETSKRGSDELVRKHFDRRRRQLESESAAERGGPGVVSSTNVTLPLVFPVSDRIIFGAYPKLVNYRDNGPDELNTNNEVGDCCGRPIMWQMACVPSVALLMHRHPNFDFVWRLENDINMVGEDGSLVNLVRRWDEAYDTTTEEENGGTAVAVVDFAGAITRSNNVPRNKWVRYRHTPKFERILRAMGGNVTDGEFERWECYTDAVQRYSRRFAAYLHRNIADNVYQFGECFVQPMAWSGNFTVRELTGMLTPPRAVGGLEDLTGGKIDREAAWLRFNSTTKADGSSSYVYHEEPPRETSPTTKGGYMVDMHNILQYEKNAAVTIFCSGLVLGAAMGVFAERWPRRRASI